jgi:hypothetical protein
MKKNRLEYLKKYLIRFQFWFHKPETEKQNRKIKKPNMKKPNQTEPKSIKKFKKKPKKQYSFWFLI